MKLVYNNNLYNIHSSSTCILLRANGGGKLFSLVEVFELFCAARRLGMCDFKGDLSREEMPTFEGSR